MTRIRCACGQEMEHDQQKAHLERGQCAPAKDQATARPWFGDGRNVVSRDTRGTIVCEVTGAMSNPIMRADRDLIVRAVNAHEALLSVARKALKMASELNEGDWYEEAKAALKLAEEGA